MKILITGGNGNIANIIKKNLFTDFDITSINRDNFDILQLNELEKYLSDKYFDILIHTAIKGGRRTKEENEKIVYQNLLMFENLLKFSYKFKLIINFDSGAIYNRSTDINNRKEEELITIPNDYYGFSKYLIYKRSLEYQNIINFRIFNIFHINEENDRFIKSCFLSKKNQTKLQIFQDKYFDFIYEDDFIKIIKYYINNYDNLNLNLPKTINLSYINKYKLSTIANMIINNNELIEIIDNDCKLNYCGDGKLLNDINMQLDGFEESLKKYNDKFNN